LCEEGMELFNQDSARSGLVSSCLHLICENCRVAPRSDVENPDAINDQGCPLCLGLASAGESTKSVPGPSIQPSNYTPSSKIRALLENINSNLQAPSSRQPKRYFYTLSIPRLMPLFPSEATRS
jgi:hypothetical protein